jgi:hypothetical protein
MAPGEVTARSSAPERCRVATRERTGGPPGQPFIPIAAKSGQFALSHGKNSAARSYAESAGVVVLPGGPVHARCL